MHVATTYLCPLCEIGVERGGSLCDMKSFLSFKLEVCAFTFWCMFDGFV